LAPFVVPGFSIPVCGAGPVFWAKAEPHMSANAVTATEATKSKDIDGMRRPSRSTGCHFSCQREELCQLRPIVDWADIRRKPCTVLSISSA
jgi:hypothetical protein